MVDKVEQAFAGFNAAISVVTQALIEMGKGALDVIIGYFEGIFNVMKAIAQFSSGNLRHRCQMRDSQTAVSCSGYGIAAAVAIGSLE